MSVRQAQNFTKALNASIFTVTAMQRIKNDVGIRAKFTHLSRNVLGNIYLDHLMPQNT